MSSPNPNSPPGPFPPGQHIIPPPRPFSPATSEYRLNHLMLRIKSPSASLRFYNDCLGLHTIFIFNAGPWTIYYLGPRDAGLATLGTAKGLLELYHVPADEGIEYASGNEYGRNGNGNGNNGNGNGNENENAAKGVGFGHVGFTVPDVSAALERMTAFGYEVIKPLGEAREESMGVDRAVAGAGGGRSAVAEGYKHVFRQLAFVRDPDGYWVELVPQVVKPPGEI